jgi:hypothetical protein
MRSELEQTRLIDDYLLGRLTQSQKSVFETKLLIDGTLDEKVQAQRVVHRLAKLFGRKKARTRFDAIFRQLLTEKDFSQQIHTIFTS